VGTRVRKSIARDSVFTAVGANAVEPGGDHNHGGNVDERDGHGLEQKERAVRLDVRAWGNENAVTTRCFEEDAP
jgi:hypothetical protein